MEIFINPGADNNASAPAIRAADDSAKIELEIRTVPALTGASAWTAAQAPR